MPVDAGRAGGGARLHGHTIYRILVIMHQHSDAFLSARSGGSCQWKLIVWGCYCCHCYYCYRRIIIIIITIPLAFAAWTQFIYKKTTTKQEYYFYVSICIFGGFVMSAVVSHVELFLSRSSLIVYV